MATRVGIIGAGSVGSTLGGRLLASSKPFAVQYGSRDPGSDKIQQILAKQPGAAAGTIADTAAWAEVLILATPGWDPQRPRDSIAEMVAALGVGACKGKVLLDCTNTLTHYPELAQTWTGGPSSSEMLQEALPDAAVFKAFSTVGYEMMADPQAGGTPLTMLFAGGPPERRPEAEAVISAVGFVPKYVGPIRYARNLDAIAELWIHLAMPVGLTPEVWGRAFHLQVVDKAAAAGP